MRIEASVVQAAVDWSIAIQAVVLTAITFALTIRSFPSTRNRLRHLAGMAGDRIWAHGSYISNQSDDRAIEKLVKYFKSKENFDDEDIAMILDLVKVGKISIVIKDRDYRDIVSV